MLSAFWLAARSGCNVHEQRTLITEVGIQNAGMATLVALSVLRWPELSLLPLMYGFLMNMPAFFVVAYSLRAENHNVVIIERP